MRGAQPRSCASRIDLWLGQGRFLVPPHLGKVSRTRRLQAGPQRTPTTIAPRNMNVAHTMMKFRGLMKVMGGLPPLRDAY